jgi:hypothetical protein
VPARCHTAESFVAIEHVVVLPAPPPHDRDRKGDIAASPEWGTTPTIEATRHIGTIMTTASGAFDVC